MMNTKELRKLINLARKSGLQRLKLGDVEFDFSEKQQTKKPVKDLLKNEFESDPQDELKTLLWSVQNIDPFKEVANGENNT